MVSSRNRWASKVVAWLAVAGPTEKITHCNKAQPVAKQNSLTRCLPAELANFHHYQQHSRANTDAFGKGKQVNRNV